MTCDDAAFQKNQGTAPAWRPATVVVGAVALTCVDALARVGEGLDTLDFLRTFCGPYADGRRVADPASRQSLSLFATSTPHCCSRQVCQCMLWPVHVLASRLGHSDPAITLRVYAHVLDDQASQAATVFERLVHEGGHP